MKILDQKDLSGKDRIDIAAYKQAWSKGKGDVEVPVQAITTGDRVVAEALLECPPDIIDRAAVGILDISELGQLGLRSGWFVVFGERA